jgi:putative flippase GtrA
VVFHFTMNKKVTFSNNDKKTSKQVVRYIIILIFNYIIMISFMIFFKEVLQLQIYISYLFSTFLVVITGFIGMNFWVFKKDK